LTIAKDNYYFIGADQGEKVQIADEEFNVCSKEGVLLKQE